MATLETTLTNLGFHFSTYGEYSELNSTKILGEDFIQQYFEDGDCQYNANYYMHHFEPKKYCTELVSKFNTHFASELLEILQKGFPNVKSIKFTGYNCPREYNFTDDSWFLTIKYKGDEIEGIEEQFKDFIEKFEDKDDYKIFDTDSFTELFNLDYEDFVCDLDLELFLKYGMYDYTIDEEMVDKLLKTVLRKELFHSLYSTHSVDEIITAYDIDTESCYDIDLVTKIITNWSKEIEEKSLLLNF